MKTIGCCYVVVCPCAWVKLLVRRGTSWHKGQARFNSCHGTKVWVAKIFLSHTPPRGGQEQSVCMCVRV